MSALIRFFLLFSFSFIFVPQVAFAKKVPQLSFYTVKDWGSFGGATCHLSNEFNNGFLMQFDGTDAWGALSLDIRQPAFTVGERYTVYLSVPKRIARTSLLARAQSESNLVIDTVHRQDVYNALQEEATIDIQIEDNDFRFFLGAFDQASEDFLGCLKQGAKVEGPVSAALIEKKVDDVDGVYDVQPLTRSDVTSDKSGLDYLGIPEDSRVKVKREIMTGHADFTGDEGARLRRENADLRDELNAALKESTYEEMSIKSGNWNLERATMMFNESENQVRDLGQKLQRVQGQCDAEKRELEAMLFDPVVTNEQQLSKLSSLERDLENAQEELELQRLRYDERIRLLETRLNTQ